MDRHTFILCAVISFNLVSGSNLMFGISVCSCSQICENIDDRNRKKQPRGLILTGGLLLGPTGCSKSFSSAACVTGHYVCYHVARDTSSLGSRISPSTTQSPPSKSASSSLMSSFFKHISLLNKILAKSGSVKIGLRVIHLHFPTCLMWMKKEGVSSRVCTHEWTRPNIWCCCCIALWHAGLDLACFLWWYSE